MHHLKLFILSPFTKTLPFFAALFILASLVDMIAWISYGDPVFAFYFGLHGFVMCYGIVLPVYWLNKQRWKAIYEIIFLFLGAINAAIDVFCHFTLKMGFTYDMVGIIKATNPQEVSEFADMFFDWRPVLILILLLGFTYIVYLLLTKIKIPKLVPYLGILLVLVGLGATTVKHSSNWGRVFLGKPYLFFSYELPPELKQYYTDFEIEVDEERLPRNVVIVVGESFSKDHSSLYGYDKKTNPMLEELQRDSLIFVYDSVSAPATHTIPCFQNIMSMYNEGVQKNWYECTTLIEVFDKVGYRTSWVSNQSQKGGYDNIVAKYAELCDTSLWAGNRFEGANRTTFDEEVLPLIATLVNDSANLNFYCVHLMGSHYTFDTRYPLEQWTKFKEADYIQHMQHQRYILATYDNSILYNDYVVRQIIRFFENDDTMLLYLSDHALDVYNSSTDYVGHATGNPKSKEAALRIPYMIYMSPTCQSLHPESKMIVESELSKPLNSTNMIYSLIEIIGVKLSQ